MARGDVTVFEEAKAFMIDGGWESADDIKVAHRRINVPQMAVDAGTVNAFLTRADETTAISTTPTAVASPIQAGYALTSLTPNPTGSHTVSDWNGARCALVFDHTANQTVDTVNQIQITAVEVLVDYTPNSDVTVSATTDALTLVTFAATVTEDVAVSAAVQALAVASLAAVVDDGQGVQVNATTSSLTTATFSATVTIDVSVLSTSAALGLASFGATIAEDVNILAGVDALSLSAFASGVTIGDGESEADPYGGREPGISLLTIINSIAKNQAQVRTSRQFIRRYDA